MNELALRRIRGLVEAALQLAGVAGVFPTPLDEVADAIGIQEVIDISDLPPELVAKKPGALRRLVGAYLFPAETAFVDRNQAENRVRFVEAHEAAHRLIPWHASSFMLDDERRLSEDTEELLEREANHAAALLLFQTHRFHERALSFERSIRTPIGLADQFGASMHAAIRYYVEHHPDPVAALVTGYLLRQRGDVPVWASVHSSSFLERYGSLESSLPDRRLTIVGDDQAPFGEVARAALGGADSPENEVVLTAVDGERRVFTSEAFFNQHCLFIMVSPKTRVRLGRRVRLLG